MCRHRLLYYLITKQKPFVSRVKGTKETSDTSFKENISSLTFVVDDDDDFDMPVLAPGKAEYLELYFSFLCFCLTAFSKPHRQ